MFSPIQEVSGMRQAFPQVFWNVLEGKTDQECILKKEGTLHIVIRKNKEDNWFPRVCSSGSLETAFCAEKVMCFLEGLPLEHYLCMQDPLKKSILHKVFTHLFQGKENEWISLGRDKKIQVVFNQQVNGFGFRASGFHKEEKVKVMGELSLFLSHEKLHPYVKEINPYFYSNFFK